jgi:hypothetical protein
MRDLYTHWHDIACELVCDQIRVQRSIRNIFRCNPYLFAPVVQVYQSDREVTNSLKVLFSISQEYLADLTHLIHGAIFYRLNLLASA